jgi:hypothetical protein
MKIFFPKKSKIGHGGPTQNRILRRTTVTDFSKTSPVFYKWRNLADVQVVLRGTVRFSDGSRISFSKVLPGTDFVWVIIMQQPQCQGSTRK